MRKLHVLLGTLVACLCVGCSEDINDALIGGTIETLRGTTSDIEKVTKTVNDAVDQAKRENKPLELARLAKATKDAGDLKRHAQALQSIKARTEVFRENITPAQKQEYLNKHKAAFQTDLASLDAAQRKLEIALRDADAVAASHPDPDGNDTKALKALREKLKEGQGEFEVLTKRQS